MRDDGSLFIESQGNNILNWDNVLVSGYICQGHLNNYNPDVITVYPEVMPDLAYDVLRVVIPF